MFGTMFSRALQRPLEGQVLKVKKGHIELDLKMAYNNITYNIPSKLTIFMKNLKRNRNIIYTCHEMGTMQSKVGCFLSEGVHCCC